MTDTAVVLQKLTTLREHLQRIAWPDVVFVGAERDLCDAARRLGLAVARLPRR